MFLKLIKRRARNQARYVDPDLDPVLLVPGVAGSVLHVVDENGKAERVWVRILGADYKLRTRLWSRFDPASGETVSLDPRKNVVVPEDRNGLYAIDVLDPDLLSWLQETMDRFAAKLESTYTASGGKKINIITHSMGGILVKCFLSLHPDLIECPSIYELMASPDFPWQNSPLLKIWREKKEHDGETNILLESYSPEEILPIFKQALSNNTVDYGGVNIPLPFNMEIVKWAAETRKIMSSAVMPPGVKFYNIYGMGLETPHSVCYGSEDSPVKDFQQIRDMLADYICLDGDGTVPIESAQADGFNAEARIGVPGEHRGILRERHIFRILKHWLNAGEPDPYYDPVNDFVILPTSWEMEKYIEKCIQIAFEKEGWEIVSLDLNKGDNEMENKESALKSLSVSVVADSESLQEQAHATLVY
ncbi:Lecithin-cholesterol acyltransferase-like 4-like protein [Drosera capensis]